MFGNEGGNEKIINLESDEVVTSLSYGYVDSFRYEITGIKMIHRWYTFVEHPLFWTLPLF